MLSFFQNFEKTVQNEKKLCLPRSISQEPYESFMVQMCKMIIYPGVFFFSMLGFWVSRLSRGWKGKKWPKMIKVTVCHTLHFRTMYYMIFIYGTHVCIKGYHFFLLFFKEKGGGGDKRAEIGPKWQKLLSVSLRISGTVHHLIAIFGTQKVKEWYMQQIFSFFLNFDFWCF